MLFEGMSLNEVIEKIHQNYVLNNDEYKFQKLLKKVLVNNKLSGLIAQSRYHGVAPEAKVVMSYLNSTFDFMFISNTSQSCAAGLFYARWQKEVNSELNIKSEQWIVNEIRACYQVYQR